MSSSHLPVVESPRTRETKRERNPFKRFLKLLGPGLITGASDDDPSGIATYSQAGAQLGLATLWTALFSYPLMATIQYICAKIGLVTGQGLAGVLRKHYPRWMLYTAVVLLVVANTINAGADLGAIAATIHLLVPAVPAAAAIFPVTAVIALMLVFCGYKTIARIFKWLTVSLFAYIIDGFLIHPHWPEVLKHTFVPHFSFNFAFLSVFVALLGTTISPYLFFWQSDQEVEAEREGGLRPSELVGASADDLRYASYDVNVGMFFSNLVMYFIIFSTASTLYHSGIHHIVSADQAARALKPLAGQYASAIFALGIIGTGVLGVPVLVGSCAYALSEAFGWRRGLNKKWYRAKQFYAVIIIAMAVGMELNYFQINAMAALFWTAVINGVLAPPLLAMIMLVSSNRKIMADKANSTAINVIGWFTVLVMTAAAVGMFVTL